VTGSQRDRLPTESIDKPYLVRSLEINLKHLSHDWHVQPVVKDPIAFSALGGALGERRSSFTLRSPVLETFYNIAPNIPLTHNRAPVRHSKVSTENVGLIVDCLAQRFVFLAERAILLTLSRFAAIDRASAKSHPFKLKIV